MVKYGAGSSTFFFSSYVDYYVSIEHSHDYCCELERMAANQPHRFIKIFYMERNSSGFYIKHCFEQKPDKCNLISIIEIYCVPRNAYSFTAYHLWAIGERSTYTMYRDYADFLSIYFRDRKFDFAFLDGRARPQVAYTILNQLNGPNAKNFIIIIDQQIESTQSGDEGLVVLQKKSQDIGQKNITASEWKSGKEPEWWI
ncbi:unnamed protein product [Rotaria sp. Silwood1]|nr:unnamed protein product [Rotaria sp. Silwood1]CAF4761660.1 unnamed protein product [Rotaria sp. Silwood1]